MKKHFKISFNAPVILCFAAVCVVAQLLNMLTGGGSNRVLFSVYRCSFADPLAYVRCVFHVFGHADWEHLLNNMMYILVLGPMLEEKYGKRNMVTMMLITAVATGLVNILLFPGTALLGASGIAFAMILLASVTRANDGGIPATFILVALIYLGNQIVSGMFTADNISQLSHIIGGLIGSVFGFMLNRIIDRRRIRMLGGKPGKPPFGEPPRP